MKVKLGELLVQDGVLTPAQLEQALAYQRRHAGTLKLGETILALGIATEPQILSTLSRALQIEPIELTTVRELAPEIKRLTNAERAEAELVLPLRFESVGARQRLLVAMADPTNLAAVDALQFKVGMAVETRLATISQIKAAVRRLFGRPRAGAPTSAVELSTDPGNDKLYLIQDGDVRTWDETANSPQLPTSAAQTLELRFSAGPRQGEVVAIPLGAVLTVGRANAADLVIKDRRMSRKHFQLTRTETGLEVADLNSANGTFVNRQRISRQRLAVGDWLQAGDSLMQLCLKGTT